jgi:hypothetical protein
MHNGAIPSEEGAPISFFGFWKAVLTPITEIFPCYFKVGECWWSFVVIRSIGSRWVWGNPSDINPG